MTPAAIAIATTAGCRPVALYGGPPTTPVAPASEICGDGVDNEGDALADCDDPDCAGLEACATEMVTMYGAPF